MRTDRFTRALLLASLAATFSCKESKEPPVRRQVAKDAAPPTATPVDPRPAGVTVTVPPSVRDAHLAAVNVLATHFDKLADVVEAAAGDCKNAAAGVRQLGDRSSFAKDRARADAATRDADPAARTWLRQHATERSRQVMRRLATVARSCWTDPAFKAALGASPFAPQRPPSSKGAP